MKMTAFIFLIACLHVSAAGFSQKVTLSAEETPLEKIFPEITKQTGISIFYRQALLQHTTPVSLHVKEMSIQDVLDLCTKGQPVTYVMEGNNIIIRLREVVASTPQTAQDTSVKVTGRVTGFGNNTPLPGVSIRIRESNISTITDGAGRYTITAPGRHTVLVFSYIGHATQERMVMANTVINITMQEQKLGLDEVVVIGYGTTVRKDLTGSVGSVRMEEFSKAPVKSFDEALAGRVAGVQVSGNDGQPGAVSNIVIRGTGSITQDNSPLYVVDGFPMEDADNNSINPADIESIDVLKDASATAIYGSRGANGVIIITTKRGSKGDPLIEYNGYYGIQENIKTIPLMSPYEFVKYQLELTPELATESYLKDGKTLEDYRNVKGLDMQDRIFRTAPMQSHGLSLRGGTDKTKYAISGNVLGQDGIIINSGFKRYQARLALDQKVNKRLTVGVNVNYSKSDYTGTVASEPSGISSASTNLLYAVWGYRPVSGGNLDDEQSLEDELFDPGFDGVLMSDYRVNPVVSARNEYKRNTAKSIFANAYAEYSILPKLKLRVTGGITSRTGKSEEFNNSLTSKGNRYNTSLGVNGYVYNTISDTWLNENTLTYRNKFGKDHDLTVLGGFTQQKSTTERYGFRALQVPNEILGIDGLDQSTMITPASSGSQWGLASFLGRIAYNYKARYLLTLSFRADGSSKFAPGNKWGYFPSGGIAWRMSNEPFMQPLKFISDAKLRLTYGQTGNNRISDFAYRSQINLPASVTYSYNNSAPFIGAVLGAYGNPDLKWETTTQVNIGYDLGLFNDRIGFTVDLYRKTTKDLLLNALLPYTTGINSAYKNIGSLQNEGLELSLSTINIKGKDFTWSSGFNISFNANKVLSLIEDQHSMSSRVLIDLKLNTLPSYIAVVGQPVSQLYGLQWAGVYQYEDFDQMADGRYVLKPDIPTNGDPRVNIKPGDIKYTDINGDGDVTLQDYTVIGRALPVHTGGFSNNFSYKGFDLSIFFQWSYGNQLVNANRLLFEGNAKVARYLNQYASYTERWQPDKPSNTLFRTNGEGPINYSSRVVEDGSYLRLKTASVGYTFSAGTLKRIGVNKLRVYATSQNLFTWTRYSGSDPEVSVRNSALTPGFDFSAYPRARTLVFGLNLSL